MYFADKQEAKVKGGIYFQVREGNFFMFRSNRRFRAAESGHFYGWSILGSPLATIVAKKCVLIGGSIEKMQVSEFPRTPEI